nr:BMP family ABC transporter substrate-binding protein [Neoroseomonas alba]
MARATEDAGIAVETVWCPDPAQRIDVLRAAASGASLVIAHGGQGEAPVAAVAPDFPTVRFAVTQGRIAGPNIACFEVLQEHSAFLAGALAGWWSEGRPVAHLSGEPVPPGLRGRAAFAAGLAHAAPATRFLTGFCGNQHDPALAEAWTAAQCAAGAVLQFAMLDGGRPGAMVALRRNGARAIGNVHDWTMEDPTFLASAIADNGWCIAAALSAHHRDDWRDARIGLERPEAVRLALAADVPRLLADRIAALAGEVIAGHIAIPEHYVGLEFRPVD